MGPDKHAVVISLLQQLAAGTAFTSKEIEKALGRISWATTICPMTRSFLQPFWAWKVACKTKGSPAKIIRHLASLLLAIFAKPFVHPSPYRAHSAWWGASDASASSHGEVYIGGWLTDQDSPHKDQVLWFQLQVLPSQHAWAFKDGDPSRRIAALEMFGTLLLTSLLISRRTSSAPETLRPSSATNRGHDRRGKIPDVGQLLSDGSPSLVGWGRGSFRSQLRDSEVIWLLRLALRKQDGLPAWLAMDMSVGSGGIRWVEPGPALLRPSCLRYALLGVDLRELKRLMEQLNEEIPVMDDEAWTRRRGDHQVTSALR
eukprot:Skav216272  [mRNA]  locus=scaffold1544:135491:148197:- [translate_table: standard]